MGEAKNRPDRVERAIARQRFIIEKIDKRVAEIQANMTPKEKEDRAGKILLAKSIKEIITENFQKAFRV